MFRNEIELKDLESWRLNFDLRIATGRSQQDEQTSAPFPPTMNPTGRQRRGRLLRIYCIFTQFILDNHSQITPIS